MPILDWLPLVGDFSLRAWDYAQQRGSPFGRDDFIKAYSKSLSEAIDLVRFENPSLSDIEAGVTLTLRAIAAVVQSYHRDVDIKINANYMVPAPPSEQLLKRARFCDKSRRPDAFSCFLVLKRWAHRIEGLPSDFVLPVERPDGPYAERLLFGAPMAYMNNQRYVVTNTLRMRKHLDRTAHAENREEFRKFFREQRKRYRSFVSWPIEPPPGMPKSKLPTCATGVIAVLNVQSTEPAVAGRSRMNQLRMEAALLPLMKVLSYFIVRLDYDGELAGPSAPDVQMA